MRRISIVSGLAALLVVASGDEALAQAKKSDGDPRILMAVADTINLCEGEARFLGVEVAWKSNDPAPSDDPPDVRWSADSDSVVAIKANSEASGRKAGSAMARVTVLWGNVTARRDIPVKVAKGKRPPAATSSSSVCRE